MTRLFAILLPLLVGLSPMLLSGCNQATATASPTVTATTQPPTPTPTPTPMATATPDRSLENGRPLAARVNQQPIFLADYQRQLAHFTRTLQAQGVDVNGQITAKRLRQQVLESLIDQTIIEQQAALLGITVTNAMVITKIQETITQSQVSLENWLAKNQLTEQELQTMVRQQLLANQLFEQVTTQMIIATEQPLTVEKRQARQREFFNQWLQKQRAVAIIEIYVSN